MRWLFSVIIALILVVGLWWFEQQRQVELTPEPNPEMPDEPQRPEPRYPLPEPEPEPVPAIPDPATEDEDEAPDAGAEVGPEAQPALPGLAESDDAVLETLSELLGAEFVRQWVRPEFVISRTVAVVNSLDGQAPAPRARPIDTLASEERVDESDDNDTLMWTEANATRYDALISVLESLTPEEAAARYARHYPLFQRAWDELGEPEPHFNDRLIDIIDHLLATPDAALPVAVVPHEGRWHFADESLQELAWGRKLLIRIGDEHRETVTTWLAAFRQAVTEPGRERVTETGES